MSRQSTLARLRWIGPLLLVVGAALALVASGRTWATVGGQSFTGQQTTGGLLPTLGWTALVMTALLLVVGPMGRRVVAVLAIALAAGQLVTALTRRTPPANLLGGSNVAAQTTSANLLLVAAGALVGLGGVLIWLTAAAWPDRRQRYSGAARPTSDTDLWKSMDAGQDPTEDPAAEPAADPAAGPTDDDRPTGSQAVG